MLSLSKIRVSIVLCLATLLTFSCFKSEPKYDGFTVSGTVKGLDSGWVKLIKPRVLFTDPFIVLDSTEMKNGTFEFKGKVENIDMVQLNIAPRLDTYLFLENSNINIELDISNAEEGNGFVKPTVSGSNTQDLYELQRSKLDSIKSQEKYLVLKKLRQEVSKVKKANNKELMEKVKAEMVALEPLEDELQNELKKYKVQQVRNNPKSPVMLSLLGISFSEIYMKREEMKAVYSLFEGDAKKAGRFRVIKKTYEDYVEKFAVGAIVPDFTLKTLKGEDLTLSKMEGSYILVDFWASWCIPCRASFPHLKEVYNKYKKDGFEVVAVATGDKDDKWRLAIKKDQTVWNHVFDTTEKNAVQGVVAKAYGVPFLPTTYLLNMNRKIIGRNLSKDELKVKLKELYGY